MSADLSQIAREKSCDYLLIIYMQKFDSNFPLIVLISCHGSLVPPTFKRYWLKNDNLD